MLNSCIIVPEIGDNVTEKHLYFFKKICWYLDKVLKLEDTVGFDKLYGTKMSK